jgi:sensor histidine kinase regulating citrate/malate metabolism
VVPVRSGGQIVGLVSVGITNQHVGRVLATRLPIMAAVLVAVFLLGAAGTWLVTRRVRRQTRGLEPGQLRDMHDYHDAVLHSVREGLIVVDVDARLHLVNDEATRLLSLGPEDVGRQVDGLELPPELVAALASGSPRHDELHLVGTRILVLNQTRTRWLGRDLGTVATLRDRTELEALTGELDRARSLADALRSQHHEAMNRLHTIVSLIELGHTERATAFAVEELQLAQRLTDHLVASVSEPALAALLLGKAAEASELGITIEVESDGNLPAGLFPARDLVTIVGNLIDNAFDATTMRRTDDRRREVGVRLSAEPGRVRIRVRDSGDGPPSDPSVMFTRGWSTKAAGGEGDRGRGLGLALVRQTVQRLHGTIEVSDDHGAVFEVVLPTAGVSAEPAAAPAPASESTAAPAPPPAYSEEADDAAGPRR